MGKPSKRRQEIDQMGGANLPPITTVRRMEKAQAKAERTTRRRIHKRNKRAAIKEKLAARAGFEALADSEY